LTGSERGTDVDAMSVRSAALVPVLSSFDAVVALVRDADRPLYVRFAAEPPDDASPPSVDHDSGLTLPGFAVNPLRPPSWWRDRPLEDWVQRRIATYAHLQEHHPERQCWLLHGRIIERGPDNEPLITAAEPVALIDATVVAACLQRGEQSDRPEDQATDSGAPPWQAGASNGAPDEPITPSSGLVERVEQLLTSWSPRSRRRVAVQTLLWSVWLMVVNVALYVAGIFNDSNLILVTLILSWLAITFTAADLVATTDVREENGDTGHTS